VIFVSKSWRLNNVRPYNHEHTSSSCATAVVDEVIGSSYARLDSYYNGLTIAHLKPLVIDLKARQGNKGQDMFEKKYKQMTYFEEYPNIDEVVFVKTIKGIFKAKYEKWDWSDPTEIPYFNFEGNEKEILAWSYQPERLNPEDHIVEANEMICDSPNSENK
jgi:hypothetical protein